MTLIKIEYLFNEKLHKWTPHRSTGSYETVLIANENFAWCDYHERWERFFKDSSDIIHFACGKTLCKATQKENERKLSSIVFTINTATLKLDVSFRTSMPYFSHNKKKIEKKSNVSHFDLYKGLTTIEHNDGKNIFFDEDLDLDIVPDEIQEAIQHYLSLLSKHIFGVECKNTYKLCQNGFKHFVKYPSCPPIAKLKDCFRKYAKRGDLRAFENLCLAFGFKPSKKFRKFFLDNPSVFLVNVFLRCIGFSDANVFNKYYNNAALISFLENNLSCNEKLTQQIFLFGENSYMYALHKWYSEGSKKQKDIVCANHLIEALINGRTDIMTLKDALYLYSEYYNRFPEPLKERILREGFNTDVHDRMCEVLGRGQRGRTPQENIAIDYTEEEKAIEGKFELENPEEAKNLPEEERKYRYHFELPVDTDALYLISDKMHNCVGYAYRRNVLEKRSLIVTMEDKKIHKGVACIEIVKDESERFNMIVQALGPCNQRIQKEYIPIIQNWMHLRRLSTTVNDLAEERKL